MGVELMLEKWVGRIGEVTIGATKDEGGSRCGVVKVGGQKTLPFLAQEGELANKPVIAFEIWDSPPGEWPQDLNTCYKDVFSDPFAWAQKCVRDYKAELLCVKLQGAHPDFQDKSAEEEARFIEELLKKVKVPLVIVGCGDDDKDNKILPACSEAARGERCLIGNAVQDNYKTLAAAVCADGHNIIAESPIDINIAKQLNILISDMGVPLDRIVINPTIGPLGYGLEYAYSIMERGRLAGLSGDKMMASPFVCFVGQETWKTKEANAREAEFPLWGEESVRGIMWEVLTSTALLQAGADILIMRHPKAIEKVRNHIDALFNND